MRIIGGKYRGRALIAPEGSDVRPTIDRVKESIFNVIQFTIENSTFVDLFSGSGSIGIEAISRGAGEVIFGDKAYSSIELIKKNLLPIKENNYKVLNRDYRETLNSIDKCDYIFVDAPFALDCINDICDIVSNRKILKENGYIIYEHDVERTYALSHDFYIAKRKTFGKVVVDYIANTKTICAVTGSFDPITIGHVDIVEYATKNFNKVIVLIAQNEEKPQTFTMKQRQKIARLAVKDYLNVSVEICEGYVFEFLNQNKIDIIVRGYRTEKDYQYEMSMAKYNEEHGNLKTELFKGLDNDINISSTKVRECLEKDENIKGLVPKNTEKLIIKTYKENQ